jgi:signal transduction histidine kinase
MRSPGGNYFHIGPRLTLTFALLIALILGGNGLLVWQFHIASLQTGRLTGGSQQLIAVLRLQESLVSFHQQLDQLIRSKDAHRLLTEAEPLRRALLDQIQQTRNTLTHLPHETRVDPAFEPTLDAIEIALPSQLEAIADLASVGDWKVVGLRLANEMKLLEAQTSTLVRSIDKNDSEELTSAVANMNSVQHRILLIVPITATSTFFIAAFFGWAITRRIIELRLEERIEERTRIARELHDTLLQGFMSVSMQLQVAVNRLPLDSPAKPLFTHVLQLTGQVIEEGRNAVRSFRAIDRDTQDLERAFSRALQELCPRDGIDCHITTEGLPQSLHPVIRDEVYSIGREALVNSFRHSEASRIDVELEYSSNYLRVLVRDDGCGIDTQVLESGRAGHWGLSGMRERAERIGAKLKVLSRRGDGTEVELRVPGRIAFESSSSSWAANWLVGLYRRHLRHPSADM